MVRWTELLIMRKKTTLRWELGKEIILTGEFIIRTTESSIIMKEVLITTIISKISAKSLIFIHQERDFKATDQEVSISLLIKRKTSILRMHPTSLLLLKLMSQLSWVKTQLTNWFLFWVRIEISDQQASWMIFLWKARKLKKKRWIIWSLSDKVPQLLRWAFQLIIHLQIKPSLWFHIKLLLVNQLVSLIKNILL